MNNSLEAYYLHAGIVLSKMKYGSHRLMLPISNVAPHLMLEPIPGLHLDQILLRTFDLE